VQPSWRVARQAFCPLLSTFISLALLSHPAAAEDCKRRLNVSIDIGHTPKAYGTRSATGKTEYSFNKRFVEELVEASTAPSAVELKIINPDGKEISLKDRTDLAKAAGADLFISIHHDSMNKKYWRQWLVNGRREIYSYAFRGYSIFVSSANKAYEESLAAARAMARHFKAGGMQRSVHHSEPVAGEGRRIVDKDLGIYDAPFAVLRNAVSPSVLLELGVLINPDEEKLLEDPGYRSKIADYLLVGLREYCASREAVGANGLTSPSPQR
jgi:N-acetylmuramoyl-L-alanine amidase